jgi:hypothetical protein
MRVRPQGLRPNCLRPAAHERRVEADVEPDRPVPRESAPAVLRRRDASGAALRAGRVEPRGIRLASVQVAQLVGLHLDARAGVAVLRGALGRMAAAPVREPERAPVRRRAFLRGRSRASAHDDDQRNQARRSHHRALTSRPFASNVTYGHGVL